MLIRECAVIGLNCALDGEWWPLGELFSPLSVVVCLVPT